MNANEPTLPEESLFLQALEIDSPDERVAFLDRACGADAELRNDVEALLRHHREGTSFLETPPTEVVVAAEQLTTSKAESPALDFLSPSDDPLSLGRLGYYEVVEVLGRGGFGVVFKARDTKLDRIVAVKTLAQSLASSATARKRFVREAKAAAAVKHENVVGIYHVSDEGPVPYLVMECVSGVSLEAKLQEAGTLDLPAILRIGTQVASGLAAAHKQGLVHRDVKPGNILLENGVERVKITDFGLARAADDAAITRSGEVAGTPQYMSPEQAQGLALDARSDLFSLGSVLYAMCTGRSPFRAESTIAALRRVCDDTPRPIREINAEIPEWLEGIINRLLAKQPSERFQTATEVADLLGLHLAEVQQSVIVPSPKPTIDSSRRPSTIGSRWWSVALIAVVAVACIMGLTEASGVTKVVPTVIRIAWGEGTLVIEVDDPTVRVSLDGEALSIRGAGLQEFRLVSGKYRLHATKDGQPVRDEVVTVTRDGRKVVSVTREGSGGADLSGLAPSAEPTAPKELKLVKKLDGHTDVVNTVAFLLDGQHMVSGSNRMVRVWDLPTRSVTSTLPLEGNVLDANVTANGRLVAVLCNVGGKTLARVWDIEKREIICEFAPEQSSVIYMRFSPDGKRIVTNSAPSPYAILWDAATGKELERFDADDFNSAPRAAFSPDGRLLAVGAVGRVQVFDIESKDVVADVRLPNARGIWVLVFAPSGKALATGQHGGHISIIALDSRRIKALQASDATVRSLRFLGNDSFLLTCSHDATLRVWDLAQGRVVAQAATGNGTNGLFVPPDGRQVITAGGKEWDEASASMKDYGDYALRLWELPKSVWPKASHPASLPGDTTNQTPKPEAGAFVLLGGKGVAERKFDTLADAVLGASDGDTIEIRGNGPFVTEPVVIRNVALAIRASDGFRPVIKLHPRDAEAGKGLLTTSAPLLLEGLELQRIRQTPNEPYSPADHWIVNCHSSAPLYIANCRFVANHDGTCVRTYKKTPVVVVRNCELFSQGNTVGWFYSARGRLTIDNSVHVGKTALFSDEQDLAGASIALRHNTMLGKHNVWLDMRTAPAALDDHAQPNPIRVAASSNLFDPQHAVLQCDQSKSLKPLLDVTEAEAQLRQIFAWQDDRNLYPQRRLLYGLWGMSAGKEPLETTRERDLAGWQQFWGSPDAETLSGHVRYEGGDLLGKAASNPEQLTAADFRLRPDSAGYRAGEDGKDLGADVDLVGPGAAYERWKKTPEYQQWLKDTGQLLAETVKPEPGAFVVLGGKGVAERKFDTLAESVAAASAGDTIEIRGNGPFVTQPISIAGQALTLRAGQGHRPVIRLQQEALIDGSSMFVTDAPLVLEGLELQFVVQGNQERTERGPVAVTSDRAPLSMANCTLLFKQNSVSGGLIGLQQSRHCELRNCLFLAASGDLLNWGLPGEKGELVIENCVRGGNNSINFYTFHHNPRDFSIHIRRTTTVTPVRLYYLNLDRPVDLSAQPIRVEARENVFETGPLFQLNQRPGPHLPGQPLAAAEAQALVPRLLDWHGQRNVYSVGGGYVALSVGKGGEQLLPPSPAIETLNDWERFLNTDDTDSVEDRARYQGGALLARIRTGVEQLTPGDFRLREGSAGYRAGKDGKDLGADVDLVGPGAAYERWKQTPDYESWLKDTGQSSER